MAKLPNQNLRILFIASVLAIAGLLYLRSLPSLQDIPIETQSEMVIEAHEGGEDVEVLSPDGKYILTMKTDSIGSRTTQTFFSRPTKEEENVEIYTEEVNGDSQIKIPFNTFSPDNKYIFLQVGRETPGHFVLKTNGEDLREDVKTVEIEKLFYETYEDFTITDVTGWGGKNLIVVNTDFKNGKTGPSWWFDVTTGKFIRLATRFN